MSYRLLEKYICGVFLAGAIIGTLAVVINGVTNSSRSIIKGARSDADIGLAALDLCNELSPGLDKNKYSRIIDSIVAEVKSYVQGSDNSDFRIHAINFILFQKRGYTYDIAHIQNAALPSDRLDYLLDTKKGNCFSLPVLYMAVAQRLGYPIYPVNLPGHVCLRYVDSAGRYKNIETTWYGNYVSDEEYIRGFSITKAGIDSGVYMRTMTYREFMSILLLQHSDGHLKNTSPERGFALLKKALEYDPKCAECMECIAIYYDNKARGMGIVAKQTTPAYKKMKEIGK